MKSSKAKMSSIRFRVDADFDDPCNAVAWAIDSGYYHWRKISSRIAIEDIFSQWFSEGMPAKALSPDQFDESVAIVRRIYPKLEEA